MNIEQRVETALEDLARTRDELRLQMHLASAETKTEWENLEHKWRDLQRKHNPLKRAVSETTKGLNAALELLLSELHEGYQRVRKAVTHT